jgi:hypothetical protein
MRSLRAQIALVLGTAVLLSPAAGCGSSGRVHESNGQTSSKAQVPGNELMRAFQLLRTEGDAVSAEMLERLRDADEPVIGLVLRAHKARTRNGPVWLVVDGRLLCMFAGHPLAISCMPREIALRSGVTLGIVEHPAALLGPRSKRRFVLYGVVPGPRRTIDIQSGRANTLTVPVYEGAFSARSREPLFLHAG